MNALDILFLVVFAAGAFRGWTNGLLKEVLGLAGAFLGLYVAYLLYEQVGHQLAPHIGCSPTVGGIIAFFLIWIGVPLLLTMLGSLLTGVLKWIGLDGINNLGGAILSLAKYAIILGIVCNVISLTGILPEDTQNGSFLFVPLKEITSIAFTLAKSQWMPASES
ncbi:MAG: CvpA family protein [Bacteroidaceae bacterium]|nr:CvpA family protein [Bacteroidaceae bacterium]